jgi:hypothetical protein
MERTDSDSHGSWWLVSSISSYPAHAGVLRLRVVLSSVPENMLPSFYISSACYIFSKEHPYPFHFLASWIVGRTSACIYSRA